MKYRRDLFHYAELHIFCPSTSIELQSSALGAKSCGNGYGDGTEGRLGNGKSYLVCMMLYADEVECEAS